MGLVGLALVAGSALAGCPRGGMVSPAMDGGAVEASARDIPAGLPDASGVDGPARDGGAGERDAGASGELAARLGVMVSGPRVFPTAPGTLRELGARWVRANVRLGETTPDVRLYLEAGMSVILTVSYRDRANIDTALGSPGSFPNAGFPFRSREGYMAAVRSFVMPLLALRTPGREVWLQCENEVLDAAVVPAAIYWRGTLEQYLAQLDAFHAAARALDPALPVVLSSFASGTLDAAATPGHPSHRAANQLLDAMLQRGRYDAADLHLYHCVESVAERIALVRGRLPPGRRWIGTEISGPDSECRAVPRAVFAEPAMFEAAQAREVGERLRACAAGGASACLWFTLFDLPGEDSRFARMGLLEATPTMERRKPSFAAFRALTGGR